MRIKYKFDLDRAIAVEENADIISVAALVFYEGTHTDASGKTISYSSEDISRIVANSNQKLADGVLVNLFKDHKYSSDSVIGLVLSFEARDIDEANLPHKGMIDLLGKQGVFASIQISGSENVTRYKDKRIKSVSAGVDLQDDFIYEVSVVPFPALTGASLYSSMQETEVDDLLHTFGDRLKSFDLATSGSPSQVIEDFAASLRSLYEVKNPQQDNKTDRGSTMTKPEESKETANFDAPPNEDVAKFAAEIAQLKQKLEEAEKEKEYIAKFSQLRSLAEKLRESGKLTPAAFNELFSEDKAIYSKEQTVNLSGIEFHLTMIDKFGDPVVTFGRATEPDQEADNADIDASAKRLAGSVLKFGGRR